MHAPALVVVNRVPTPAELPSQGGRWDPHHEPSCRHTPPPCHSRSMMLDDIHDGVVGCAQSPVTLPFEHHLNPGHRLGSGLLHAAHRRLMRLFVQIAAEILDDVDFIAVVNRLNRGECDANFSPKTGEDNLLASRLLHRSHELLVIPRVHAVALNRFLIGINCLQLRPDVSTK